MSEEALNKRLDPSQVEKPVAPLVDKHGADEVHSAIAEQSDDLWEINSAIYHELDDIFRGARRVKY